MSPELPPRVATYRLQLHAGFTLDDAAAIVDYLAELGISHVYLSPHLQATPGSPHGYDVVDPGTVDEDRGGEMAHARLCRALRRHGLRQLLDIVPNHMGIGTRRNHWWWDVLERGQTSRFSAAFDLRWDQVEGPRPRLLLPCLARSYGEELSRGKFRLMHDGWTPVLHYEEHEFPLSRESLVVMHRYAPLLASGRPVAQRTALERFTAELLAALTGTEREFGNNGPVTGDHCSTEEVPFTKAHARESLARALDVVAADVVAMHALLETQHYRLASHHLADTIRSYRRFFDIDNLAAIHPEDPHTFQRCHARISSWVDTGHVDGLRIDHIDGLADPAGYLKHLRQRHPHTWLLVEKVLVPGEKFPDWLPADGCTGYDFLNEVSPLFLDARGEEPLRTLYREITGDTRDPIDVTREAKRLLLSTSFAGTFEALANQFFRLCQNHLWVRDIPRLETRRLLEETLLGLPVYRLPPLIVDAPQDGAIARLVAETVQAARARCAMSSAVLPEFLHGLLRGMHANDERRAFHVAFAQLSGPLMAKGYEDCALYRWPMLLSTAEVGSAPGLFAASPQQVHRSLAARVQRPHSLLATSTHDTKQSEDVRARLHVLSELPAAWSAWCRRHFFTKAWGTVTPRVGNKVRYQLLQALVGAWPLGKERAQRYLQKAVREAREHTSWADPQWDYEQAVSALVEAVYGDEQLLAAVAVWVAQLTPHAHRNALAECLVKLTAPGVPDLFQGTELWRHRLVDPDNRDDVDFRYRRSLLRHCTHLSAGEAMSQTAAGLPKMWMIHRVLRFRAKHLDLFGPASPYDALYAEGPCQDQLFAYARGAGAVVVAVPRLFCASPPDEKELVLRLPPGRYHSILDDSGPLQGGVTATRLFRHFPVALLWGGP